MLISHLHSELEISKANSMTTGMVEGRDSATTYESEAVRGITAKSATVADKMEVTAGNFHSITVVLHPVRQTAILLPLVQVKKLYLR